MDMTIEQTLRLAIHAQTAGQWQVATAHYRSILQRQPKHPYANHNLGVIAVGMNKPDDAQQLFKTAFESNCENRQFCISYIECLIRGGNLEDAKKLLNEAADKVLTSDDFEALEKRLKYLTRERNDELKKAAKYPAIHRFNIDPSINISVINKISSVLFIKREEPSEIEINTLLEHYKIGRYGIAEGLARSMTLKYPNHQLAWKVLGAVLKQAKQFQEALIADEKAVALVGTDAEAHGNLGITLHELGRLEDAEASCKNAIALAPGFAAAHFYLGNTLSALSRLMDAELSYKQAITLQSDYAQAHSNLGNVQKNLGHLEEAEASYRKAISQKPDLAEAYSNLGSILDELGRSSEAEDCFNSALRMDPDFVDALCNFAVLLGKIDRLDEAEQNCRHALQIKPDQLMAHCTLAKTLIDMGRLAEAENSCRQVLKIDTENIFGLLHLGNIFYINDKLDEAEACYRRVHEIEPKNAHAMSDLATILEVRGRYGDALEYYRKAGRLGFNGARVKEAFMLPAIMGTKQEVLESRMHFEQKLADLMNDNVTIDDPMKCISSTNFYLAYQGLNDRNLQIAIAKYYENACPSLLFTAPHCKLSSANKRNKIRLGIFSEFMYSHSISNCYSQILENLSLRDEFEVLLISNSKIDEGIYKKFNGEKIFLPNDLATARKKVANMELDLIIYLDIGMSPFGYFLAFSRLAPVQCVLGGHPVTTGIPNMDYFISNALMEPEDAVLHYSEKLVNLPRPLFIFERPAIPPRLKTRQELGLPIDRHIYLCPMKLQKIHPDFDDAISRILQIDSEGVIIFFEDDKRPSWAIDIKNRFERTIPDDVRQRILFRPWIKYQDELICTIAAADVVLDPFHFGIGSTAAYTFAVGTPLVTKEGEFLRGRVGSGFCRMLGVAECSVETTESYCQMAADIVINKSLREGISSRILKNNSILYENTAPIDDFIDFICSSYADAKIV